MGRRQNLDISCKFWGIMREFGKILGKYRILDRRSLGCKGGLVPRADDILVADQLKLFIIVFDMTC